MKTLTTILTLTAILSVTPLAHADTIPLGGSGWEATISDNVNVDILVDAENEHYVLIEIIKTFTAPPQGGVFPGISIDFTQVSPDTDTVSIIVLNDEIITNNTGYDWTDYHWSLEGPAAFSISATEGSGFDIDPFTNADWTPKAGWSPDFASALNLDGGTVAAGSTFSPGLDTGAMLIQLDLSEPDAAGFTLTQNPTPEPATMLLLAAGLPLLARRKRTASRS
ncbi:MAG: hypothetical protein QGH60_20125 [Phycisphaerae bacterium]|jgi:hypothetical protein|nr:hypothetical protein [Phycisphaerae bacterium]